jgi:hypothetical protein
MSDICQVYLVLTLHRRVLQWDSFSQVEFSVFQDMLREHGLFAILGNSVCAVEGTIYDANGNAERVDFWLKIRADWVFLSLEVRSNDVFVIHETKQGSGP